MQGGRGAGGAARPRRAARALQRPSPNAPRPELSRLQIYFCGVRGSTPAAGIEFVRYGGHTSCLALAHDGAEAPTLVLDAGTGLRGGLAPARRRPVRRHDHAQPPALGPRAGPAVLRRGRPPGRMHEGARARAGERDGWRRASVLAGFMSPPYFPIEPTQLRGNWTFGTIAPGEREVEGFTVLAREIPHKGGRTFGYRISDGHSTVAYMPDHCPTALGPGEDGFGEYHAGGARARARRRRAGARRPAVPRGARRRSGLRPCGRRLRGRAGRRAGVRSVVLFHHRHNRTDDALDGLARRLGGGTSPAVSVATEGTVLEL